VRPPGHPVPGLPAALLLAAGLLSSGSVSLQAQEGVTDRETGSVTDEAVFFREDFDSLEAWEELTFRKISRHSRYRVVELDGERVLEVRSEGSASGIVLRSTFDVFASPILQWRWQAANVLEGGDATRKEGDDYPIRVYVIFRYDPGKVGGFERLGYEAARAFYGEYPPLATVNYIWANRPRPREPLVNPFTHRAVMFPMDGGSEHLGQWRTHRVNMLEDYRRAFGEDPPREASLAVMGDSDNTGGSTLAYLDYLEVRREP